MTPEERKQYNETWKIRYPRPNKNSQQVKCSQFGGYLETTKAFRERLKKYRESNYEKK